MSTQINISAGELLDRLLILRLKMGELEKDSEDFKVVSQEHNVLEKKWDELPQLNEKTFWKLIPLITQLTQCLNLGWGFENGIRERIKDKSYNEPEGAKEYIELSINIHANNDERSTLKNKISSLFDGSSKEVKVFN